MKIKVQEENKNLLNKIIKSLSGRTLILITKFRNFVKTSFNKVFFSLNGNPQGINIGGGNWMKFLWLNCDERWMPDKKSLDATSRLPAVDNSVSYVFSSHFFEHVDDKTAQNLFNETYRVLKKGGIVRIIVPDFDLALKQYHQKNHGFFDDGSWGIRPRYENWEQHGVRASLENKLSYVFFGYSNKSDEGRFPPWKYDPEYYCGPIKSCESCVEKNASSMNIHEFSRWLLKNKPVKYHDLGHINVYDVPKFKKMLSLAGFNEIYKSEFKSSKSPVLRSDKFDNRPDVSLYIEAVK